MIATNPCDGFHPDVVPEDLRRLVQWVCWDDCDGRKVPVNPRRGGNAASDNRATWATFDTAVSAYLRGGLSGVGFVFTESDVFTGIDLDDCIDGDGVIRKPWAVDVIESCRTYAEVSPSGTGVKLFARGKMPGGHGRKIIMPDGGAIELYDRRRYFTVTTWRLPGAPASVCDCQPTIDRILAEHAPPIPATVARSVSPTTCADVAAAYEAVQALSAARADDYQSWLRVGLALHDLDAGNAWGLFDLWEMFSQRSTKFEPGECARLWFGAWAGRETGERKRATLGTLIAWAREDAGRVSPITTRARLRPARKAVRTW